MNSWLAWGGTGAGTCGWGNKDLILVRWGLEVGGSRPFYQPKPGEEWEGFAVLLSLVLLKDIPLQLSPTDTEKTMSFNFMMYGTFLENARIHYCEYFPVATIRLTNGVKQLELSLPLALGAIKAQPLVACVLTAVSHKEMAAKATSPVNIVNLCMKALTALQSVEPAEKALIGYISGFTDKNGKPRMDSANQLLSGTKKYIDKVSILPGPGRAHPLSLTPSTRSALLVRCCNCFRQSGGIEMDPQQLLT